MTLYGGGYEQGENSARGALTVTARVSNGSSRHAMPTLPELVYAALLYKDGASPANKDFSQGTAAENGKLIFSFQKPEDTSGTFTLEIFAFVKTEGGEAPQFSKETALLSGYKEGLAIVGDAIVVTDPIALSSDKQGTVNLKIKVPDGCTLEFKELKIDDTTESDPHFAVTGASPNFTIKQNDENEILAGAYPVTFTVKKGSEIVHIFSEYINVINGLCTDTWSGSGKGAAKEITQGMISSTVYVRGTGMGGWYANSDYKDTATASDTNSGSFLSPLATIQKAMEKIIAINDGESAYTIYVDGTLTQNVTKPMADFSKLGENKKLTLTIKALSGMATLDANGKSRGVYANYNDSTNTEIILTLEKLVIKNGNVGLSGGGIFFQSENGMLTLKGCEIKDNKASKGGAVYVERASLAILEGTTISGNSAEKNGGAVCVVSPGTFTMGGSASIPAGDDGKNDVYLDNGATITVADDLAAATTPVATITLSAYTAGRQVLTKGTDASAPAITQDICDKFALSEEGWEIVPDGANGVLKTTTVYAASTGSDSNSGDRLHPFATIQKAVDTVLDMNDGADDYTIFVDGTLDGTTAALLGTNGMADFSALDKKLTLTIKSLSENAKATLDGGGRFNVAEDGTFTVTADGIKKSIIYANPTSGTLNLTLENLVITGGNTSSSGGGIYFDPANGTLTMNKCEISGNISERTMGGGGGIYNKGTLTMEDCTISENRVQWYGGGVLNRGTLTITGGTISDNTTWRSGGGIYNDGGTATITGCTIKSCKVAVPGTGDYKYGGAGIYITGGGSLTAKGCEITENTVTADSVVYGGGVFVYEGTFTMEDGTKISKNRADWDGGGVYVAYSDSTFIMNGGEISGNHGVLRGDEVLAEYKANTGGGGVCVTEGGTFTMNHGTINGNTSGTVGGGVYVAKSNYYGAGTFTMKGGTISENTASEDGGGVYVYQESSSYTTTFTMEGGTIEKNEANYGGGVYVNGGAFTMTKGTISGNTAGGNGGGVYNNGGTFTQGGTVSGNSPDDVYPAP